MKNKTAWALLGAMGESDHCKSSEASIEGTVFHRLSGYQGWSVDGKHVGRLAVVAFSHFADMSLGVDQKRLAVGKEVNDYVFDALDLPSLRENYQLAMAVVWEESPNV
jgi:hypothetical protein